MYSPDRDNERFLAFAKEHAEKMKRLKESGGLDPVDFSALNQLFVVVDPDNNPDQIAEIFTPVNWKRGKECPTDERGIMSPQDWDIYMSQIGTFDMIFPDTTLIGVYSDPINLGHPYGQWGNRFQPEQIRATLLKRHLLANELYFVSQVIGYEISNPRPKFNPWHPLNRFDHKPQIKY